MLTLNIGIVVVRKAEKPTICGLLVRTASTNFSGGQLTPRSTTSKPAPSSMMMTRFFPMSDRKGREADDMRLVGADGFDELLWWAVDAEVDDLEAGALEHDDDEVLPDVRSERPRSRRYAACWCGRLRRTSLVGS